MSDDGDPVRAFSEALTSAARHHLELNYESIRLIRAAVKHVPPADLAAICSAGIGWHTPVNARALLLYRIRREAHIDDQEEASDGPQ